MQHEAICPPGRLGEWLEEAGLELEIVHPYGGDPLPTRLDHDGLVVLGGTMGANDDADHAWLAPTKRLLADAVRAEVPVLGVCLGHQLLVVACGGRVQPNPNGQTTGLRRVDLDAAASDDPVFGSVPAGSRAVHWNHDAVISTPPGADVLARTADGAPQVLRVGPRAWGVQFHPEAGPAIVSTWADGTVADGELTRSEAEARLGEIEAADEEVAATWRAWARRFAAVVLSSPGAARR